MPYVETPDDLADDIANMADVYGACKGTEENPCDGKCRPHFISDMAERIRAAVANEKLLEGAQEPKEGGAKP